MRRITNKAKLRERLFVQADTAWDSGDLKKAFSLFMEGAKLGNDSCQLDLGYFYDVGISVPADKRAALKWYRRAYRQNNAGAANNIATIHRDFGEVSKMLWWYRQAARMGDIDAMFLLADRYETGKGIRKNLAKAAQFYAKVLDSKTRTAEDTKKALAGLRQSGRRPHSPIKVNGRHHQKKTQK